MNNKLIFILLTLVLLILPLYRFIQFGDFATHDKKIHILRIDEYYHALRGGQIPPRLAPNLLGGASYPLFLMNYHLPYLIGAGLMAMGRTGEEIIRVMTIFTYILTVFGSLLFFRALDGWNTSMLATINLIYSPYLLANIFVRGAIPELMATMILIWILYLIVKKREESFPVWAVGGLIGLQLMTQTVVALVSLPLVGIVVFTTIKDSLKIFTILLKSYILGALVSAFILMPAVFERHYFEFDSRTDELFYGHLIPFLKLIKIPFFKTSDSSFQLSLLQTFLIIGTLVMSVFFKKPRRNLQFVLLLMTSWLFLYLITPQAYFWWKHIVILRAVLFPWRLLMLVSLASSILLVYLVKMYRRLWLLILGMTLLSVFFTRHFLKPVDLGESFTENENQFITATTNNEFKPRGARVDSTLEALPSFWVLKGEAQIVESRQSLGKLSANILVKNQAVVQVKVLYFPSWHYYLDGSREEIIFPVAACCAGAIPGLPQVELSSGRHNIEFIFEESTVRKAGNFISLGTLIAYAALGVVKVKQKISLYLRRK